MSGHGGGDGWERALGSSVAYVSTAPDIHTCRCVQARNIIPKPFGLCLALTSNKVNLVV